MKYLTDSVLAVFPECTLPLNPSTTLGSIPGWDSMNAVNLMLEINDRCQVDIEGAPMRDITTLGELAKAITAKGGNVG